MVVILAMLVIMVVVVLMVMAVVVVVGVVVLVRGGWPGCWAGYGPLTFTVWSLHLPLPLCVCVLCMYVYVRVWRVFDHVRGCARLHATFVRVHTSSCKCRMHLVTDVCLCISWIA